MVQKSKGIVFDRARRDSQAGGAIKVHRHDPQLRRALGQAAKVIFHGFIYEVDTNARVTFRARHGCFRDVSPEENGFNVTLAGTTSAISTVGEFTFETSGAIMSDMEVLADVSDSTTSALVRIEFELWCTIIRES